MKALVPLLCALLLGQPGIAHAVADPPRFDFGWLLFGDLYYVPSHHTAEGDGAVGAVVRRLYLTLDAEFDANWFGRLRFETNQSGAFETYHFDTDFKDLYLGRRLGAQQVLVGLSPTPTFNRIESLWGLRYLMRTPMDLQGIASRDTGIAAKGSLNRSGSLHYHAMLGTEVDFGSDSNESTKWMAALSWQPARHWTAELYGDIEDRAGPADRRTVQGFIGYHSDSLRWGAQYANQDRDDDPPLELASVFAVRPLGENASLIGRIDRLIEPSPKGDAISYLPFDPSVPATLLLAGFEFRAQPWLRLTPNVVMIRYDRSDEGTRPETDLHLRLTLFFDFE